VRGRLAADRSGSAGPPAPVWTPAGTAASARRTVTPACATPNDQIENPPPDGRTVCFRLPYVVVVPRPHGWRLGFADVGSPRASSKIAAGCLLSAILTGLLVYQWWQETFGYWNQSAAMQDAFKGASVSNVTGDMTSRGHVSVAILLLVLGIMVGCFFF